MGSWTVVERTDDKLTIVFKRRSEQPRENDDNNNKMSSGRTVERSASSTSTRSSKSSKKKRKGPKIITPIVTTTRSSSAGKSSKSSKHSKKQRHRRLVLKDEKLDMNTETALKNIHDINKYLRCKYNIKPEAPLTRKSSNGSSKTTRSSRSSRSTQTRYSTATDQSDSSEEFSNADKMYREVSKAKVSEAVDHKGYPLSHPLATTPFPGATSAAQREKARQMLRSLGRRQNAPPKSEDVSSSSKKSSKKSRKSSRHSSSKSRQTKSRGSSRTCPSCSACVDCTRKCIAKNHMVTDAEREKFMNDIVKLREVIQRPEKRREKRMKSPFDNTQSGSDNSLSNRRTAHRCK